jgi:hypothetical protein
LELSLSLPPESLALSLPSLLPLYVVSKRELAISQNRFGIQIGSNCCNESSSLPILSHSVSQTPHFAASAWQSGPVRALHHRHGVCKEKRKRKGGASAGGQEGGQSSGHPCSECESVKNQKWKNFHFTSEICQSFSFVFITPHSPSPLAAPQLFFLLGWAAPEVFL